MLGYNLPGGSDLENILFQLIGFDATKAKNQAKQFGEAYGDNLVEILRRVNLRQQNNIVKLLNSFQTHHQRELVLDLVDSLTEGNQELVEYREVREALRWYEVSPSIAKVVEVLKHVTSGRMSHPHLCRIVENFAKLKSDQILDKFLDQDDWCRTIDRWYKRELVKVLLAYEGHEAEDRVFEAVWQASSTSDGFATRIVKEWLLEHKDSSHVKYGAEYVIKRLKAGRSINRHDLKMLTTPYGKYFKANEFDVRTYMIELHENLPEDIRDELNLMEVRSVVRAYSALPNENKLWWEKAEREFYKYMAAKVDEGETVEEKRKILFEWSINVYSALQKPDALLFMGVGV